MLFTMNQEIFSHIDALEKSARAADKARAAIRDRLIHLSGIFSKQKYMLGAEFSMLDVAIAPLLWRHDYYGINLPKSAAPLMKYANRVFSHQGFIDSLTPAEKLMRR
jgi:RNA polymerase-associated protein